MPESEQATRFLPVTTVAVTLGRHPLTVCRMCREGRFASACRDEDGRKWLIAECEVLYFLEQAKARQKQKVRHDG